MLKLRTAYYLIELYANSLIRFRIDLLLIIINKEMKYIHTYVCVHLKQIKRFFLLELCDAY